EKHPELGKALAGAWFETLAIMMRDDPQGKAAREIMATAAGTDLAGYEAQLTATHMYTDAAELSALMAAKTLQESMASIARFSFDKGLLGSGARSADAIGITYPDGKIYGDNNNIKLRFDNRYVQMAADGKL